ncbi:hypothetical protein AUP68_13854 [Ilyonectria robusta]
MQFFLALASVALIGQARAACTRVSDAEGNALSEVEPCPVERNSENIPTGRLFCAQSNAWLSPGGNWGTNAHTTDKAVTFKIIPLAEVGTFDAIYYSCSSGTDGEFLWTRDYSFGAASASIVA